MIYWGVNLPKGPMQNFDYYAAQAREEFGFRRGDISTLKYIGTETTDHDFVIRYCWQCERTEKQRAARAAQLEANRATNRAYMRKVIVDMGPDGARESRDLRRKIRGWPEKEIYPYDIWDDLLVQVYPELA